jgi:hypothetical protein
LFMIRGHALAGVPSLQGGVRCSLGRDPSLEVWYVSANASGPGFFVVMRCARRVSGEQPGPALWCAASQFGAKHAARSRAAAECCGLGFVAMLFLREIDGVAWCLVDHSSGEEAVMQRWG